MPAPRGFWTDPDDAAEVSAALDDYADQLATEAKTRRDRAGVARLRGYAAALREAHGLSPEAPPVRSINPTRGGAAEDTERVS